MTYNVSHFAHTRERERERDFNKSEFAIRKVSMKDICYKRWYEVQNALNGEVDSWIQQLKAVDFEVDNADKEFHNQPPLLTNVPENIKQVIFSTVDTDLFISKFFERKILYGFFVLRYDATHQPRLEIHNDMHDKYGEKQLLTVVFTYKSDDCIGGTVATSERYDGTVLITKKGISCTKYMYNHNPAHRSMYVMLGTICTHKVFPVIQGWRIAIVLFYELPDFDKFKALKLWNYPLPYLCEKCYFPFQKLKSFNWHRKKGGCCVVKGLKKKSRVVKSSSKATVKKAIVVVKK